MASAYDKFREYWLGKGTEFARKVQAVVEEWLTAEAPEVAFESDSVVTVRGRRYELVETAESVEIKTGKGGKEEERRAAVFLFLIPRCLAEFKASGKDVQPDMVKVAEWIERIRLSTASPASLPTSSTDTVTPELPLAPDESESGTRGSSGDFAAILEAITAIQGDIARQVERFEQVDGLIRAVESNLPALAERHRVVEKTLAELGVTVDALAERVAAVENGPAVGPATGRTSVERKLPCAEILVGNLGIEIPPEAIRTLDAGDKRLDYMNWLDALELFQGANPTFSVEDVRVYHLGNRLTVCLQGAIPHAEGVLRHWQIGDADAGDPLAPSVAFAMALKRLLVMFGFGREFYRNRAERESKPAAALKPASTAISEAPAPVPPTIASPATGGPPPPVEFKRPQPVASPPPRFPVVNGTGAATANGRPASASRNW